MDHLDCPSDELWDQRRKWFEGLFDVDKRGGGYIIGEQANGLLVDLQAVYCSGAFISCLILACTIVDAQLREAEAPPGFDGGMKSIFELSSFNQELEWLRNRRNRLIHFKESKEPAITVDMHYSDRVEHERDAQRAVRLVADVLFEKPWV